ncbi:histidine kinase [Cohnella ginsengisoli]|uniref:Histidine kinase n=1 Tax=Cohnella ginsengisoli TaxID=425004 RepID=A0A9X4QLR2_9BACL|nr:histidine kinase [Cohnella ginsengisoli]MDG0790863.1 histidine kinase [Cohnella ginsengisoli]
MKAWFRDLTLKRKLVLTFTLLIAVVVLLGGWMNYRIAKSRIERAETMLLLQNLKQTAALVDYNLDSYQRKTEIIFANSSFQETLASRYDDFSSLYDAYRNRIYSVLEPVLLDMTYSSTKIFTEGNELINVIIYSDNPSLPRETGIIRDLTAVDREPWVQALRAESSQMIWRGLYEENGERYISVSHTLKSFRTLEELGILTIMIPEVKLKKLLEENNENSEAALLLFDADGNSISGSRPELPAAEIEAVLHRMRETGSEVGRIRLPDGDYMVAATASRITGWQFTSVVPYHVVTGSLRGIALATATILIVSVLLCLGATVFISHLTTRRLIKITNKMNRVKEHGLEPLSVIAGKDEIGQLDGAFNRLITSLNGMTEERVRLERQKTTLQIDLLQLQINPHLLYNTLATIQWRAKQAGTADIQRVTESLIRFFKRFLNKGGGETTFGQELEMIREYTQILQFTYNMSFAVEIDVAPELLDVPALHLLLQPIVENAVVHGIRPSKRQGLLRIEGYRAADGKVVFVVSDNGIGIDADIAAKINRNEALGRLKPGYGLSNVKKRIALVYGEGYGVSVQSGESGTSVIVTLPAAGGGEDS